MHFEFVFGTCMVLLRFKRLYIILTKRNWFEWASVLIYSLLLMSIMNSNFVATKKTKIITSNYREIY